MRSTVLNRISTLALFVPALLQFSAGCSTAESTEQLEVAAPSDDPEATDSPAGSFIGAYRFVGGEREMSLRNDAIDAATSDMNILSRTIARDKLRETTPVPSTVNIALHGKLLTIAQEARTHTASLDGTSVKVKSLTGEPMDLTCEAGAELVQNFTADGKSRVNRYRLDGNKLVMAVTIKADALPKAVEYELTYERQ